jgi:hypothetical protein
MTNIKTRAAGMRAASIAAFGLLLALVGLVGAASPAEAKPAGGSAVAPSTRSITPPAAQLRQGVAAPAKKSLSTTGAPTAQLHQDAFCDQFSNGTGDLCLWWGSAARGVFGSMSDFYFADSDLFDNVFLTAGLGQGSTVANNSESTCNRDLIYTAWVYTGVNFTGTSGYVAPGVCGDFTSTFKNNVESLSWSL